MITGIDVSSWQPSIDWLRVAAAGYRFALVKTTGGGAYANEFYAEQIAGARAAGLLVGHYHYAYEADVPGVGPLAEAEYFLAHADLRPGELVALDVEEPSAWGNLSWWALAWLRRVAERTGARPFLYSYPYYFAERQLDAPELAGYPLWFADYDGPDDPPRPWREVRLRQVTADRYVPGIGPRIDANEFYGSIEELAALGVPSPAPTDPAEGERRAILAYTRAAAEDRRGAILWEGAIDCREWGGRADERLVRCERIVTHRLRGRNYTLTLGLWDRLRAEGRIVRYPSGAPVAVGEE